MLVMAVIGVLVLYLLVVVLEPLVTSRCKKRQLVNSSLSTAEQVPSCSTAASPAQNRYLAAQQQPLHRRTGT
jgi:hypothetical protein